MSNKVEEGSEGCGGPPYPCQKHPVSTSRFSRFLSSLTFSRQCSRNPPALPSNPPAVRRGVTKRDDNEIRPSVSKTMSGVGRARTVIRGFVHVRRKWADIVPYHVKLLLKHCCKAESWVQLAEEQSSFPFANSTRLLTSLAVIFINSIISISSVF